MDTLESALQRPNRLQRALRDITERLAHELSKPTVNAPGWTGVEWRLARAVASIHGISGLLATRLRWQGPPGWRRFIDEQRAHIQGHQQRIQALLGQLDTRSRQCGIALVGLKGTALHAMEYYRAGDRPMADLDLLARPEAMAAAGGMLESLGFGESFANWKHKVFIPAHPAKPAGLGEHEDNPLKIELHDRIAEHLPLRATDLTESVFSGKPHSGLNGYPTTSALMSHLLLHAAGSMAVRCLRHIQLHDIALVSARMIHSDWMEIARHESGSWWALPPLTLAARYYHLDVPAGALDRISARNRWFLRRLAGRQSLSDVSMSHLWIEAFPGIAWSRSLGEMLQYIRSRVRPGEETRRLRRVLADTQVAMTGNDWSRMSQGRRMLRWLSSRPTRADTVHAVRFALAQSA